MVNSSGAEGGAGGSGGGGGGGGGGGDTGIDGGGSRAVDNAGAGGSGRGTQHPAGPPTASGLLQLGCGPSGLLTLHVTTTTGRSFSVVVDSEKTVVHLKKVISKNLKVSKDRICLLHRERVLHDGTLRENGLVNDSKIILTPNVETGLLTQRAENTVMQALESLNDKQVNDFLSGKSPLNLSVRLGDHMMLIQLQLSTLSPSSTQAASIGASGMSFSGGGRIKASTSSSAATSAASASAAAAAAAAAKPQHSLHHHHHHHRGALGASSGSTVGHSPEEVGALGLAGHKESTGNNQHLQPRHQSAPVPSSATSNSKAGMLVRRPVATAVADGDVSEDGLEQPASKRPARIESHRVSEAVKTLPLSCSIASTSRISNASLAKNNNEHCTGDNNNSNRNDSNISSSITSNNRTTIHFLEDQQRANVARMQQQKEAMEHDEEKKKVEDEKLANRLADAAAASSSNNLQTAAPVSVSSPIKSLSKLVSARMMTSETEKDADVVHSDVGDDRPATADGSERDTGISECSDPITANLTSCLCRRLDGGGGSDKGKGSKQMGRAPTPPESSAAATSPSLLHRTALNPIAKHKAKLQGMQGKKTPALLAASAAYVGEGSRTVGQVERTPPSLSASSASGGEQRSLLYPTDLAQQPSAPLLTHRLQQEQQQNSFTGAGRRLLFSTVDCAQQKHQPQHQHIGSRTKCLTYIADPPSPLKNPALAEASRNLTQTLRKLSKRVFTGNVATPTALSSPGCSSSSSSETAGPSSASSSLAQPSASSSSSGTSSSSSFRTPSTPSSTQSAPASPCLSSGGRSASSGAVIESMKHHGKGIYSGTFSGTLNPALQDKFGRPKRDISTIIHILNDLLSAAPQCGTSEATVEGGNGLSTGTTSSSGTKIYFDPTTAPAGSSATVTGNNGATSRGSAVAGSSGGIQRHACNHHPQSNRNGAGGSSDGGSNTSWFVPAPAGSKKSLKEMKNLQEAGSAVPNKKCSTSNEEDTLTASRSMHRGGMIEDGACVGCKMPSGSTNRNGGGSSNSYRSLLLSSVDGSISSTKIVPLTPLATSGSSLLLCKCGSSMLATDGSSGGAVQPQQQQCKLCIIKAVEMENSKTKLKLDSLRLIMKQKRERREARKLQSAPYHSTVGVASPRTSTNDVTPRLNKIATVPVHASSHSSNVVTADGKHNDGAVGCLPDRQQFQRHQPGQEDHQELKEPTQQESTSQDQPGIKSSVQGNMLQGTHPEESTINSNTTAADVPFSNTTDSGETANSNDAISSEATKAIPKEAVTPSTATDSASSASADASTSNGATHLVEEVDTVA